MKNTKYIQQTKDFIEEVVREITAFVPIVRMHSIKYLEEETNQDGGEMSVEYHPSTFSMYLYVYKDLFKQIPEGGLTEGFKNYLMMLIGHEFGHCYLWEFKGRKRDIEKTATLIGFLIMKILEQKLKRSAKK